MLCPPCRRRHAVAQHAQCAADSETPALRRQRRRRALRGDQRNARGRARRRARDGRGRRRAALRRARGDAARRRGARAARGEPGRGRRARRGRGLHVPQLRLHDVRQPELPADVRQVRAVPGRAPAAGRLPADGRARRRQVRGAGADRDAARARGWLCLFVARARDVGHHGDYVVPSPHHAGRFEEPSRSREVLEAFREAHGSDLATVKCTDAAAERGAARRCARSWAPPSTTRSAATRRRRRWPTSSTV